MKRDKEWEVTQNMEFRCSEHSKPDLKYILYDPNFFIGKWVKPQNEHMWVKIDSIIEDKYPFSEKGILKTVTLFKSLSGTLDNIPIWDIGYKLNDRIKVRLTEIQTVCE